MSVPLSTASVAGRPPRSSSSTVDRPPARRVAPGRRRSLSPRARKLWLLLHVGSSTIWLGLTVANLVLAVAGLTTDDPARRHAVYPAVDLVARYGLLPMAVAGFVTGVVVSVATPWGLVRRWWVTIKLALAAVALPMTAFSLLPMVSALADRAAGTPAGTLVDLGRDGTSLVAACCFSLTMYLVSLALSVYKPGGRTPWTRRT